MLMKAPFCLRPCSSAPGGDSRAPSDARASGVRKARGRVPSAAPRTLRSGAAPADVAEVTVSSEASSGAFLPELSGQSSTVAGASHTAGLGSFDHAAVVAVRELLARDSGGQARSDDSGLACTLRSPAHAPANDARPVANGAPAAFTASAAVSSDAVSTLRAHGRSFQVQNEGTRGELVDTAAVTPGEAARPGALLDGRYVLREMLGRGSSGEVWAAEHVELRTEVAVKLFFVLDSPESDAAARFRFEAQVSAQLGARCNHVVPVYDVGASEYGPFLVMERVRGRTLREELTARGPLAPIEVLHIVEQVARALDAAHSAGIIHRDLKPSNLILESAPGGQGDAFCVRVTDFGVAKAVSSQLTLDAPADTASGMLLGSPAYMSPEQLRGDRPSAQSDLWALGVVAFEALTGALPFEGRSIAELIVRISTADVARGAACRFDPALRAWFGRALAQDPERRFKSAVEMARALRAALDPEAASRASVGAAVTQTSALTDARGAGTSRSEGALAALKGFWREAQSQRLRAPLWLKVAAAVVGAAALASGYQGVPTSPNESRDAAHASLVPSVAAFSPETGGINIDDGTHRSASDVGGAPRARSRAGSSLVCGGESGTLAAADGLDNAAATPRNARRDDVQLQGESGRAIDRARLPARHHHPRPTFRARRHAASVAVASGAPRGMDPADIL